jgi:hypothetical protein
MDNIYNENYRTYEKEIDEHTRRWKDLPCSWISRINIVKVAILPKSIYTFKSVPITTSFFTEIEINNPKIPIKHKRPQIA